MKSTQPTPSSQPLYRQIKARLTERLSAGEWRPGEPTRARWNSPSARGPFVASHAHARSQQSFLRLIPDEGALEGLEATLIGLRRVRADAASARLLELPAGATLVRLRRTLSINGERVLFEEARLPADLFQGLDADVVERHRCMLYSMCESAYHVKIVAAAERPKAISAGPG